MTNKTIHSGQTLTLAQNLGFAGLLPIDGGAMGQPAGSLILTGEDTLAHAGAIIIDGGAGSNNHAAPPGGSLIVTGMLTNAGRIELLGGIESATYGAGGLGAALRLSGTLANTGSLLLGSASEIAGYNPLGQSSQVSVSGVLINMGFISAAAAPEGNAPLSGTLITNTGTIITSGRIDLQGGAANPSNYGHGSDGATLINSGIPFDRMCRRRPPQGCPTKFRSASHHERNKLDPNRWTCSATVWWIASNDRTVRTRPELLMPRRSWAVSVYRRGLRCYLLSVESLVTRAIDVARHCGYLIIFVMSFSSGTTLAQPASPDFDVLQQQLEAARAKLQHQPQSSKLAVREQTHPAKRSAYDTKFQLAQSLSAQHTYAPAALAYDDVYTSQRKGVHAPDALLGLADCLASLGEKPAACAVLDKMQIEFPTARAAVLAGAEGLRVSLKCH